MNRSICAYPWTSAAIRPNGAVIPCCRYPNLSDPDCFIDTPDPRNSAHWQALREKMLAGEYIEGCKSCYQDEANNLESMRQQSLLHYTPKENKVEPIVNLEIALSNLCNLACAHCSNYFSTKWYTEDLKFNRVDKIGVAKNDGISTWDLSTLRTLKLIGGEPFMEQPRFIELLNQVKLENINLQICTNGTVLPNQELKSLIEKCNNVYLCVSIDGLYNTNDWYRWPGKFSEVIDNIRTYEQWWKDVDDIYFIVHHVVNSINILELSEFVSFMETDLPLWRIEWDWIRWPYWQQLSSLSPEIKEDLKVELANLNKAYINKDESLRPNPYKVSLERMFEEPTSNWDTMKSEIQRLSSERNLDFLNMVRKFKKYW